MGDDFDFELRGLQDFFVPIGVPGTSNVMSRIGSNLAYFNANYEIICLMIASYHAVGSISFWISCALLAFGWNRTWRLNATDQPTYCGEFVFGNIHRNFAM